MRTRLWRSYQPNMDTIFRATRSVPLLTTAPFTRSCLLPPSLGVWPCLFKELSHLIFFVGGYLNPQSRGHQTPALHVAERGHRIHLRARDT